MEKLAKKFVLSFWALAAFVIGWWLFLQFQPDREAWANFVFNGVYAIPLFVAAWFVALAAWQRQAGRRPCLGFFLAALGLLTLDLAQMLWLYANFFQGTVAPALSLADLFYLIGSLLMLFGFGMPLMRLGTKNGEWKINWAIFGVFVAMTLALAGVIFSAFGWWQSPVFSINTFFVTASLLTGFLLVLNILRCRLSPTRDFYTTMFFGLAVQSLGDALYAVQTLHGTYWNGNSSDALFAASALLYLFAARQLLAAGARDEYFPMASQHLGLWQKINLPLVFVLLAVMAAVPVARLVGGNELAVLAVFIAFVLMAFAFSIVLYLLNTEQQRLGTQLGVQTRSLNDKIAELRQAKYYLDNVGEAVVVLDPAGRILYTNRTFLREFCPGAVKAEGRSLGALVSYFTPAQLMTVAAAVRRDRRWIGEFTYRRRSTAKAVLATICSMSEKKGSSLVVVMRDITDRKQVEEAKTQFVSFVAHQLREPMTQIRWSLENIQGDKRLSKATRDSIGVLENMIAFEARFINDLLNISRLERGVIEVEEKAIPLSVLLTNVVAPLHKEATDRHVILVEPEVPAALHVLADEEKSAEALRNVVHNAIKYTRPGTKVEIGFVEEKNRVIVSVRDRGTGIPKEMQKMLFDIKSGENSANLPSSGAGLGLYFADKFIKLVGGDISFKTSPRGSTFFVSIPKAKS